MKFNLKSIQCALLISGVLTLFATTQAQANGFSGSWTGTGNHRWYGSEDSGSVSCDYDIRISQTETQITEEITLCTQDPIGISMKSFVQTIKNSTELWDGEVQVGSLENDHFTLKFVRADSDESVEFDLKHSGEIKFKNSETIKSRGMTFIDSGKLKSTLP